MQRYILKRFLFGLLTIFATSTMVFFVMRGLNPADPSLIMLPPEANQKERLILQAKFGLDKPLYYQYGLFLKNALHGDFGTSFRFNEPTRDLVLSRIPATLQLTVTALVLYLVIGMIIGIISAVKRDSLFDRFGRQISLIGMAVPSFAVALFLILAFGVTWRIFPISGRGGLSHMVLPVISMSLYGIAAITRLSRSSMIEVLKSEHIVMANVKGVPNKWVILIHALKNGCIPVITILGLLIPGLILGSVVVESIFSWPGLGSLIIVSIFSRDYPVVQFVVIILSALIVVSNLLVDILYAYIDPRIRYQ
jgi:peptide/nickel transport system permease protein